MVVPVVILLDKGFNLGLKRARQVVVFQQDAILHGLVPALDLALCLGMGGRAADMMDAMLRQPLLCTSRTPATSLRCMSLIMCCGY